MLGRLILVLIFCSFVQGQCPGTADIIFAVPGSDVVPGNEFFPFERFLIQLTSYFQIDRNNVNIGLILYGREPLAMNWPQPFRSKTQINARISLMTQRVLHARELNGGNDVASAITLMRHMFRNPTGYPLQMPRANVQKIGVVFVYGSSSPQDYGRIINATRDAKNEGITLYAVGKGQSGPEFPEIGSDYCKLFSMGRFIDGLPNVLAYLGSSICAEMDPFVNVTNSNCFPQLYYRKEPEPVTCLGAPIVFQDPENCAYYYHCLFRKPVQEKCPLDMLFDPLAGACNTKTAVSCYTDISCPARHGLFPHPTDCNKFVNCFDFIPYVQTCPKDLWFDTKTGYCEAAFSVACPIHKKK